jgi:hypothetical protein
MNGRQSGSQTGTAIDDAHREPIRTEGPADADLTMGQHDTDGSMMSSARRKLSPRSVPQRHRGHCFGDGETAYFP